MQGLFPIFQCFCLGGIATIGFFVQLTTLLQITTPDTYRGRIFGMYSVAWALFLLLGTGLTGIVGDQVSILLLLNLEACLFFPAATSAWFLLRPRAVASFAKQTDQQGFQMEKER